MTNALEITDLTKTFKDFTLDRISMRLPAGYIMGFIGPNGAGKTTTIKLILNMLKKDHGSIRIFGKDHAAEESEIKERIGVVMDHPFYVEDWTLADVAKALSPFYRRWDAGKFQKLLSDFELDPKKKVRELSRGMKMKLMIASALSHDADLLLLDEPTSGLDAVARSELMDILSAFIGDESKAILFSTHITTDLEKIADYITFINGGRILYSDTKDELMERFWVVKGGVGALRAEDQKRVIGYREHGVGFDGLIDRKAFGPLPSSVIAEPSNLDEIVVRFNMEGKNNG